MEMADNSAVVGVLPFALAHTAGHVDPDGQSSSSLSQETLDRRHRLSHHNIIMILY